MLDLYKARKKVLITGGSRGIGAEAVREFTGNGAEVAFFYRKSDDNAFQLSRETGALNVRCNVANPESVKASMEVAGAFLSNEIDVLICNAGILESGPVTEIGADKWNEIISTNLNSAYYCIKEVLPGMISRKKGCIIIVSSMWGQVGESSEVAYSTAKAGLIGLTKALAKEVGPSGIRVNCIAPGIIDTSMNEEVASDVRSQMVDDTPLGRIGTPADVAKVMKFLASDEAGFITGQIIGVNGGLVI